MEPHAIFAPNEDDDKPTGHPMTGEEFIRALGFSDADIAAADAAARQRFPEYFVDHPVEHSNGE